MKFTSIFLKKFCDALRFFTVNLLRRLSIVAIVVGSLLWVQFAQDNPFWGVIIAFAFAALVINSIALRLAYKEWKLKEESHKKNCNAKQNRRTCNVRYHSHQ